MKPSLQGLTLTELLVSSIMIGIVMLGVGGFTATVKQMQETSYRGSHIDMALSAIINVIKKDTLLAVGESSNKGIIDNSTLSAKILCLRQDQGDITSYSDDRWICWHAEITGGILYRCADLALPITNCPSDSGSEEKIPLSNPNTFFTLNLDAASRLQSVTITLKSRHNLAKSIDEYKNPETTLTLEVMPILHTQ